MDTGSAMKLLQRAFAQEAAGELEAAYDSGTRALQGFGEDRTGAAAAHHLLAVVKAAQREPAEALAHLDAALPLRQSTGDQDGLLALHQQRLEVLLQLGQPPLDQARAVVAAAEASGSREALAASLHQLADLSLQLSEPAAEVIERGLGYCERAGEEKARAALLTLRARIEEDHRALATLQQALEIARQARSRAAVAQVQLDLAARLDPEPAALLLVDALDTGELLRDDALRIAALRALARVESPRAGVERLAYAARLAAGDERRELLFAAVEQAVGAQALDRAILLAQELVAASETAGQRAAANFVLGQRLAWSGKLPEALSAFEVSASEHPEASAQASALAMAGQVHAALGRPARARQVLEQALEVAGPGEVEIIRSLLGELP